MSELVLFLKENYPSINLLLMPVLAFLSSLWVSERFKASLKVENDKFLSDLKWKSKVKESAERVAEYLAMARSLEYDDSKEAYNKANQLSWELAMWLPEDIYRKVGKAITGPNQKINPQSVVVDVRNYLLEGSAGGLTQDDIVSHAPGAGRHRMNG